MYTVICCESHSIGEGCDGVHVSSENFKRLCRWIKPAYSYIPDGGLILTIGGTYDAEHHDSLVDTGQLLRGVCRSEDIIITEPDSPECYAEGEAKEGVVQPSLQERLAHFKKCGNSVPPSIYKDF